jgi:predicted patatin/cPLA2 family phospholipase
MRRKYALVVEGGAMRGIFANGVLDVFMEKDFYPFDLYIGVSAGANNLASYLAKMRKRNYQLYTYYSTNKEFISIKKFIKGGHLIDLDWMWDITAQKLPLDVNELDNHMSSFIVGVTEAESGESVFLEPNRNNILTILKASSAMPIAYRNSVEVEGVQYIDGGVSNPIPVNEAIKRGATDIVILRSRQKDYLMK